MVRTKHPIDIINWINEEESPSIGIIKAAGGIGKTTIATNIHDTLIDIKRYQFIVVFINPSEILREFREANFENHDEYDLFNLFKKAHPQGATLDEISFYNNYSQGNILMILDGIDEIISTVPSFTLESFLNKLNDLNKKIGRGKILITCRDIYIDDIEHFIQSTGKDKLAIYELLPFNKKIAEQYFFKNELNPSKIKKGLELLKQFVLNKDDEENGFIYPPFLLEIIIDILQDESHSSLLEELSSSELLIDGYKSDYVLHQIFNRERIKKEHGISLGIDDQAAIFCLLAVNFKGRIEINRLPVLLKSVRHFAQVNDAASGLKDHPLLRLRDNELVFRYSFLIMEFYTIGIYNLLKKAEPFQLNDSFINLIGYKANYNSIISKGILFKLRHEYPSQIDVAIGLFRSLIAEINNSKSKDFLKHAAVSNLFLIVYQFVKEKEQNNFDSRKLLIEIFSEKYDSTITNLCLLNIPYAAGVRIDFSNLYVENSIVDGFSDFVLCNFDEVTYFVQTCVIKNIKPEKLQNLDHISMVEKNFHMISGDNSLDKIFRLKDKGTTGIEDEIRSYFKLFFKGDVLKTPNVNELNQIISKDLFLKTIHKICLEDLSMVNLYKDQYQIESSFKPKIQKFVFQGKIFREIKQILRKLPAGLIAEENKFI